MCDALFKKKCMAWDQLINHQAIWFPYAKYTTSTTDQRVCFERFYQKPYLTHVGTVLLNTNTYYNQLNRPLRHTFCSWVQTTQQGVLISESMYNERLPFISNSKTHSIVFRNKDKPFIEQVLRNSPPHGKLIDS